MQKSVKDTVEARNDAVLGNPEIMSLQGITDAKRHRVIGTDDGIGKRHAGIKILVNHTRRGSIPEIAVHDIVLLDLKTVHLHKTLIDILTLQREGIIRRASHELYRLAAVVIENMSYHLLETGCIVKHRVDNAVVLMLEEYNGDPLTSAKVTKIVYDLACLDHLGEYEHRRQIELIDELREILAYTGLRGTLVIKSEGVARNDIILQDLRLKQRLDKEIKVLRIIPGSDYGDRTSLILILGHLLESYVLDADRRIERAVAEVKLKSSVIVVRIRHLEREIMCLPVCTELDVSVLKISVPVDVRRRNGDLHSPLLRSHRIERDNILLAPDQRQMGLIELN